MVVPCPMHAAQMASSPLIDTFPLVVTAGMVVVPVAVPEVSRTGVLPFGSDRS